MKQTAVELLKNKQELPKTEIDWSKFPQSTKDAVGYEPKKEISEHNSKFIVFTLQDGEDWVQHSVPLDSFERADEFAQQFRDKKLSYLICKTVKQGYNGK